ncbi:thioesterase family protein [Undibacterium sp. CY21W]|uniref:acyl-CoA thioesterase n=1 Tax=Undibacterium sp. CY21W TaxID=2762293 RepID=UPI0021033E7C|nr:thioesterase family protein [Undibacterium sp. CY21W]
MTDAVNYTTSPRKTEYMMTWDYPQPYTLKLTPASSDIDGLQHTNNAVYVQWCEVIGWAHSEQLGLSLSNYQELNRAMAIRHAEYDYLLPSVLGDKLILGTWIVASDGKLNMERRFQLIREADQAIIMRGKWDLVCIEISTGKPKRMPPEFCDIYLPAIVK